MHWDDAKFWIAVGAFFIVALLYGLEISHSSDLRGSRDHAFRIASECLVQGQAQIDTLASEVNEALFLNRSVDE